MSRTPEGKTNQMMRRIIHIIDNLDFGGGQEIVYSLTKYMKGCSQTVVALHGHPDDPYVSRIRPFAEVEILSGSKRNLFKILVKLWRLIVRNKEGTFHFHLETSSFFGGFFRRLFSFNMVVSVHAHPLQLAKWKNALLYWSARSASFVVGADKDQCRFMKRNHIAERKIRYIPIGTERTVDLKGPDMDVRKEFNVDEEAIVLLNIARMVRSKGQRDLIFLMKELQGRCNGPGTHLLIVGYGPEKQELESLREKLGVQEIVTIVGKREDLHNFYATADWFVMPCHDESMGVVIYEALGYGLPVLAYDSGSIREVISNENRGILTSRDYRNLADVISNRDVKVMKQRLKNEDLSFFKAERMAADYDRLYAQVKSGECGEKRFWGFE